MNQTLKSRYFIKKSTKYLKTKIYNESKKNIKFFKMSPK
jgi:hypothetical protein